MSNEDATHEAPTRRDYMKYGGAVVGGSLLAGCAGDGSSDSESTPTVDETETDISTNEQPDEWTVTMQPAGTRTFTEIPETYTVYADGWLDIMTALGQHNGLVGMNQPEDAPITRRIYDKVPGLELDLSGVENIFSGGSETADEEIFYEIDPDINMIDRVSAKTGYLGMGEDSVQTLEEQVAPFFGSFIRRQQFSNEHPYYSLYDATRRASQVFREEERFAAWERLHNEFINNIQSQIPDGGFDQSFAYLNDYQGTFYPRKTEAPGTQFKPFRDLKISDENNVFGEDTFQGDFSASVGAEALLEANPDVIFYHGGPLYVGEGNPYIDGQPTLDDIIQRLQNDSVVGEVTAINQGRILAGNLVEAGPILNLFNTEDMAKQAYPDIFGEYKFEEYPENEQLFDRQRVADIINGDI